MAERTDELPVEPVADPSLVCGIDGCTYVGTGKLPRLALGKHRFNRHGIRTRSAEPKAAKARQSSGPREAKEPREPSVSRRARAAATSVTKSTRRVGTLIYPRLPIAGTFAMSGASELGDLLAEIAEGNPKLLAWLEKSEEATAWIGLAWWTGGFVYALGVDLEKFPEDGPMAEELGVSEIVRKVDAALDARETKARAQGALTVEPLDQNGDRGPSSVLDVDQGPRTQDVAPG